eukprot:NODE_1108_length_1098_cov_30.563394_g853_i0.p1 GENE.NODE_1108_length_1098_cov_30.563394_g853_i0~~NODE_1108_length_1098_cov_30.563394_g853_i0.p1  ORF type:complete len:285 (-),score=32.63 NODE_1108_length_1098_cov_30.563394_g853_i0:242-1048(-)
MQAQIHKLDSLLEANLISQEEYDTRRTAAIDAFVGVAGQDTSGVGVCSTHNKQRTSVNLEPCGNGMFSCTPASACKAVQPDGTMAAADGPWMCGCGTQNYPYRTNCFQCGAPAAAGCGNQQPCAPGDWFCQCGEHNFARRGQCHKCKADGSTGTWATPGQPIPMRARRFQPYKRGVTAGGGSGGMKTNGIGLFNLPFVMTEDELWGYLTPYSAESVKMVVHEGRFRGYAFAYFADVMAATRAKEGLEGLVIGTQSIDVKYAARPKQAE